MKRYIHNNLNTSISLREIVKKIEYFVVVDDCDECDISVVDASEDIDYLLSLPDNLLSQISDEDIAKIEDVNVLDRLVSICKNRLNKHQLDIIVDEYKKKIELDDDDKKSLLAMFRECNDIVIQNRKKNNTFLAKYNLDKNDVLSIMHSLKFSDFDHKTRSINFGHLGNHLVVLHPNILIPKEDIILGANLYVKLDIDESAESAVAFIK